MHSNQTGSTKITSETRDKNEKKWFQVSEWKNGEKALQQEGFSGRSLSLSLSPFFQAMRRKNRNSQQRGFCGRTYRWWKSVLKSSSSEWKNLEEHNRRPQQKHLSSNAKKKEAPQFKKKEASPYLGSNDKKNWKKQISLSKFK